jgi:hypothetical protein
MNKTINSILFTFLFITSTFVRGESLPDYERVEIINLVINEYPSLKKRFDGKRSSTVEQPAIVLMKENSSFLAGLKFPEQSITLTSIEKLVDSQIATFISLSKFEVSGDTATIKYNIPSNAKFGTMTFKRDNSKWKLSNNKEMRSSDGAKTVYGFLYNKSSCKDGSEMAFRWNFYSSGGANTYNAVCPASDFPEIAMYKFKKKIFGDDCCGDF